VTLQEIEVRLRREPELDKLGPKVVEALARAVMRFVRGDYFIGLGGSVSAL
jgi:hypothetical protein